MQLLFNFNECEECERLGRCTLQQSGEHLEVMSNLFFHMGVKHGKLQENHNEPANINK
jgi:hypothetical protein